NGNDNINISGSGVGATALTVAGLSAQVNVTNFEPIDHLTVNALGGNDTVNSSGLPAGLIGLTLTGFEVVQGQSEVAFDSGGGAAGAFAADADFAGGSTFSTTDAIDTTGVASPAPQAVYQTERFGNFTYTVPGLTPGASYTVRLHFAEIFWTSAGQRVFNVAINGQQVLSNFDIFATAGGKDKAVVEQFTATADAQGRITTAYTTVVDNAKSSGIEVGPA